MSPSRRRAGWRGARRGITRNSPTMQSVPRNTTITHAHCTSKIRMRGTRGHYAGGTGRATGGEEGETSEGKFPIPVAKITEKQTLIRG